MEKIRGFLDTTPYYDVYVFSVIHPINQPSAPWTQSQYHYYEVIPEYLEIHSDTAKNVYWKLRELQEKKIIEVSFITYEAKNLAFGFTAKSNDGVSNSLSILHIKLSLNRLYKAFSWMLQWFSIITIALSLIISYSLWTIPILTHINYLRSDLFALLTTLTLLLLSNYIVIPK